VKSLFKKLKKTFESYNVKRETPALRPRPNKKVRNKIGGVLDKCFTHYQKTKIQGGAGVMVKITYFIFFI